MSAGSKFKMKGGSITGNTMNGSMSNGGGVAVLNSSEFIMSGGTISNNTSKANGGGVHVNSSTFTMEAGSITGNQADNASGWGGGVSVTHNADFTMKGGSITGNAAGAGGGGVAVAALATNYTGEFDMRGGTVTGNTLSGSDKKGAEIYTDTGVALSGEVQIGKGRNGVFLDGGPLEIGADGLTGNSWVYIEELDGAAENDFVAISRGTITDAEAAYLIYLSDTFAVVTNVEGYVLKSKEAPTLTGPVTMSLEYDYTDAVSGEFTVTGVPAPTVSKTSGSDSITWDDAEKKLKIAAGLDVGTYPVTLTASNGVEPDAAHTFTLTVSAPVLPKTYNLSFDADGGKPVPAVQALKSGAAPVAVADPAKDGYSFLGWYDDADKKVDLTAFRMPENNVLLKAKWEKVVVPKTAYTLTVENGEGGGRYEAGQKAAITATVPKGKVFVRWEIKSGTGTLERADSRKTVFTMGESDAVVRAVFQTSTAPQTGDNTNATAWLVLLLAALAGCVGLLFFRKRHYGKRHR